MAIALVFFVLTMADIAIVLTTADVSKIHEKMTREEIFTTFGTNDGSVPEYRVSSVTLPRPRTKRQNTAGIYITVETREKIVNLHFKPTPGILATSYTPVWRASTDPLAYNGIHYDPDPDSMRYVGEFDMYQDVDNEAAIVVYMNRDGTGTIEGVVSSNYAIKSLPSRLLGEMQTVGKSNYFVKTHKRSIEPNADEVSSHCVIYEISPSSKDAIRNGLKYNHRVKRQRSPLVTPLRIRTEIPDTVYPEILIVLDRNVLKEHNIVEALRFTLAFWNSVDMVYSTLREPRVRLNIAGIIIATDYRATPYISESTKSLFNVNATSIVENMGNYFYGEQLRFPLERYDMIFAMTTMKLCFTIFNHCYVFQGTVNIAATCSHVDGMNKDKNIRSVGVFTYNLTFGGVDNAVRYTAYLLGVYDDKGIGDTAACPDTEGYAMSANAKYTHNNFKWSDCSKSFFQEFFKSETSKCLDNEPFSIKPVEEVLPGRWLSMDGQCQNYGFKKACRYDEVSSIEYNGIGLADPECIAMTCKAENNDCIFTSSIRNRGL